jgi:ABC-type spermidine/putrescine transport system permease subunit II
VQLILPVIVVALMSMRETSVRITWGTISLQKHKTRTE